MKDKTVQFIFSEEGDWVIVYINGFFKYEGHDINERRLLDLLEIPYKEKWLDGEHPIFGRGFMALTDAEYDNLDNPTRTERFNPTD